MQIALINEVIAFLITHLLWGVNCYGTISGPIDTYRVPKILRRGLGNGKYAALSEIPPIPKHIRTPQRRGEIISSNIGATRFFERAPLSVLDSHWAPLTLLWRCNEACGLNWRDVVHVNNLSVERSEREKNSLDRSGFWELLNSP